MDIAEPKTLRVSRNTEEISAHHFFKMRDTGDMQWMYPKFDGWTEIKEQLPENVEELAADIQDEYAKLTNNNTTSLYIECLDDIELAATRIYGASILLDAVNRRWGFMEADIQKQYIETLKGWNFLLNPTKPIKEECERLAKQLRAAKTKLKRLEKEKVDMERKSADKGVNLLEILVGVKNVLKRDLDLKKISLREWHYTLESLSTKKSA